MTARSMGLRGFGQRFRQYDFAVPRACFLPLSRDGFGFVPMRLTGLLAAEFAAERTGDVDQASAFLPAAPTFLEFACPESSG